MAVVRNTNSSARALQVSPPTTPATPVTAPGATETKKRRTKSRVMPEPILLDIKQAAARLNTTVSAIRNLLWAGELPYVTLAQKHMMRIADLDAWITRNLQKNGA